MISIVIPTLNEEKYLPRLLGSIKNQTSKDYEIIVADANSEDATKGIAKKYGCTIVNGGKPGVGRNNGVIAAKGDILLFLDADAELDREFLQKTTDEMEIRKLDIAGCYLMPQSKRTIDKVYLVIYNSSVNLVQYFLPHASGSGIFCKKWLHNRINGFDTTIILGEDIDYVKRGSKHGKFRMLKSMKVQFCMRRFDNKIPNRPKGRGIFDVTD